MVLRVQSESEWNFAKVQVDKKQEVHSNPVSLEKVHDSKVLKYRRWVLRWYIMVM